MKIATIVPIPNLEYIQDDDYHMALAHLVGDPTYQTFYRQQSEQGRFVLMDNGVVECGVPLPVPQIVDRALRIQATEVVVPDVLNDRLATLQLSKFSAKLIRSATAGRVRLMAVPQGHTPMNWVACCLEMLEWDFIDSIGVSKFVGKFWPDRLRALGAVPELIASKKDIHLLGCVDDPTEIARIEETYPGRVRGCDSGIAAIMTQAGRLIGDGKPRANVELDFHHGLELYTLESNIREWKRRCGLDV